MEVFPQHPRDLASFGSGDVGLVPGDGVDVERGEDGLEAGRFPEGSLLVEMFSETEALGSGEVVVGAALDPGEAPVSAIPGLIGTVVRVLRHPLRVWPGRPRGTSPTRVRARRSAVQRRSGDAGTAARHRDHQGRRRARV